MQFFDADAVHAALDYGALVEALREGHRKGVDAVERLLMAQPSGDGGSDHFLILPAWQRHEALGIKLVTVFPGNRSKSGPPGIQAVYVLFDGRSGTPVAVIDGTALTLRKTAADSALGATFLARPDAANLLMVGAGNQAPHQIMAHCAVRPSIERVFVWNRTLANAYRLSRSLNVKGIEISVAEDLPRAVASADLICCATMAAEPVIEGAWLKPGVHLDLVGGYTNDMREADDEAARRASVFVDSRWFTIGQCGDITGPMQSGALREDGIAADLFDLCKGTHPGRRSRDEITLFKNAGGAHLDLMTARFAYEMLDRRKPN
jgi:ornithine cyclodeaminase/alanine dehydrogenase-like protein (mu-crystallin family)